MKSQKSNAETQIEAVINHINIIINNQNVKIQDAKYMRDMVVKLLEKCEELRKGRDLASQRREDMRKLYMKEKKSLHNALKHLRELQESEGES